MRIHPERRRGGRRGERGAALLVVMVAVAILTALAVDVAYENRVRLQIAGNGRDALRAEALAKSGVNLSRLVLAFQSQLDGASQAMCGLMGQVAGAATAGQGQPAAGSTGAAGQTQDAASAAGCPRPQIWNVIPVSSGLVQALFGGAAHAGPGATPAPAAPAGHPPAAVEGGLRPASFGDFEGAFDATIEDEGAKVNLQLDSLGSSNALGLQVQAYLRLVCDPRWDAIFEREDANGQRTTRQELAVYLHDWVNTNTGSSALTASFPGGGNCNFVLPANTDPFEKGFGDKNYPYDRGTDRYRVKNDRLDSLDELHLVAGLSDTFMAAFGDAVTVYLPKDAGRNVNSTRPEDELLNARIMADPTAAALVEDPAFQERLHKAHMDATMGGFLSITPVQFAGLLQALGVPVKADYTRPTGTSGKTMFTDTSVSYRIKAVGMVGDVEKKIDAVVFFDPQQAQNLQQLQQQLQGLLQGQQQQQQQQQQQPQPQQAQQTQQNPDAQAGPLPGRLIHWRVE